MRFRRCARRILLDELPRRVLVRDSGETDEIEQQTVSQRQRRLGHLPAVYVVHWIAELLVERLLRVFFPELPIFVDRARDHADVQALGAARLAVDVEGQALLTAVAQPFFEAEAVALRFRDLLTVFIEEHLVVETLGRTAAEDARDLGR